jgi:hypothetical protein
MIISVNGKIGSGKDTVGAIIQYLTATDTSDKALGFIKLGYDIKGHHNSIFEVKKFAGKLKQTASLLTGISIEKFEDQEFKKTYLGEEWNSPYNIPFSGPDFVEHDGGMTVRTLLQKLGTEAMRDGLHENVWVNALFADYRPQPNKAVAEFLAAEGLPQSMNAGEENYPNWIITDMRFPNEMEAVVEKGGLTIRVVRYPKTVEQSRGPENVETIPFDPTNQKHMDLWKGDSSRLHPSETALDDHTMHYEIINDGTIEDLVEKVREILIERNII